eukprot:Hpha_TRINITY_DN13888_c0_g1::TRINITY_DN13888_c0_g1_i1::g.69565::m.69565/K00856/E2.7.1.20, ADK; adenosine kinase
MSDSAAATPSGGSFEVTNLKSELLLPSAAVTGGSPMAPTQGSPLARTMDTIPASTRKPIHVDTSQPFSCPFTSPHSGPDEEAGDPLADLASLDDEITQIETRLRGMVIELARLRRRGVDVELYDSAVCSAIGSLKDRHRETDSPSVSRKESMVSAVTSQRPRGPGVLLGLCNPLLDMSLRVDESFLHQYGLEPDGWAAASPEMLEIFTYLDENPATQYIPGGSGMNTLRVAQWCMDQPGLTCFLGTVGCDDFGTKLHRATEAEGVGFPRVEIDTEPTGTCAVLLTGESRSLVANLGASAVFDMKWLTERPELSIIAKSAGLYYATGFFLRTSPETVQHLGKLAGDRGKEFALNMSAAFVCESCGDLFRDVLPRVDLLFGNCDEARALAKALDLPIPPGADVTATAAALQAFKKQGSRPRTVVITRGPDNVVAAAQDGVASFDTTKLPPEQVIDTNGAGDAFAGGFLARRLQGGSVEECVRMGQWAATVIIGQPGCTLPQVAANLMGSPVFSTSGLSRRLSIPEVLALKRASVSANSPLALDNRRTSRAFTGGSMVLMNRAPSLLRRGSGQERLSRSGSIMSGTLLGLCNPLLDMSLHVEPSFLEKYGLSPNGWAAATDETLGIFDWMAKDPSCSYTPGGSGMNTLRVAQWVLEVPGSTTFLGTIGRDAFGERLVKATEAEGVSFPVVEHESLPTGTCAVLLTGDERSLVANLGASAVFEPQWLRERPSLRNIVESAGVYYVTGFFLRTSPDTVLDLAHHAQVRDKELSLNMSAPFVCEGSVNLFREFLPKVDLLFGNAEEAFALAKALGFDPGTDTTAVARRLQQIPRQSIGDTKGRTVVITQGPGPVVVATDEGVVTYETSRLPTEQVIDTNGAGDAFAGGFLARRLQGGSVMECVRMGQWTAAIIIGQPGCTLPPFPAGQMPGFGDSLNLQDTTSSPDPEGDTSAGNSSPPHRDGGSGEKRVVIAVEPSAPKSDSAPVHDRRPSMAGQALKLSHRSRAASKISNRESLERDGFSSPGFSSPAARESPAASGASEGGRVRRRSICFL